MEERVLDLLRALHAGSGFLALVVAPLAMVVRKGGDWHRRWGKAFFYSMAVVAVTAIILGVWRSNMLMALVAVFSFHLIATGYRSLHLKKLHEGQKPQGVDIVLHGTAGVINAALFLWGAIHLLLGHKGGMYIVFTAFGIIGLLVVFRGLHRFYKRAHEKQEWLYGHMIGFLAGYIATVSAFSAVNMDFIKPVWLQWLWPTVLGTPLIFVWVGYYQRKFGKGRRAKELLDIRIR